MRAPAPQQGIPPAIVAKDFFGLSVPVMLALQPKEVPCLCGRCQGVAVQFEGRLHFLPNGQPEVITRPAPTAPEPAHTAPEQS